MSTSKAIDRICIIAVVVALLICLIFMNGAAFGIGVKANAMAYENRLFDSSKVHTIDIVIDDWDAFLETAQSEEYSVCSVVIDGEAFKNVGIRGKGNTSLSTVASMDSDRYSFKIEFDQYDSTKSYYGLDKLSLNNLIQDNTMMKDYLTYQMMNEFGVAAPLCSFTYITVNGEDWGLYLAVEAVEESFLQRNYGSDYGDLYKPDSMDMGGGRGNGKDFDFESFMGAKENTGDNTNAGGGMPDMPSGNQGMQPGGWGQQGSLIPPDAGTGATQQGGQMPQQGGMMPGWNDNGVQQNGMMPGQRPQQGEQMPDRGNQQGKFDPSQMGGMMPGNMGGGFGMNDSAVTKLQYIDDDPDSYATIFSSAKTDVTNADQARLIAALKDLSEGKESAVDAEAVIRYFVVHNFVVNADSYTGSMIHNYYLYEEDGQLSMIPWDYNLAFGTFQGNQASKAVNDDIDAPLSVTGSDRPMIDWIFSNEAYTQLYHQYFREFLNTVDAQSIIAQAKELIASYVEKDPTKFCTYEEFEKGTETLAAFCELRAISVAQQLDGEEANVDASAITLSDMGTMGGGFGGNAQMPEIPQDTTENQRPAGKEDAQMPGQSGMQPPSGDQQQFPGFGGQGTVEMPEGMGNMFPGSNSNGQVNIPGSGQATDAPTQGTGQWSLLLVTVLALAAGFVFVFKFKR